MFVNKFHINGDQNLKVPSHLNFAKYMLDNLRKYDNGVALVNSLTNESITYKEFAQYSVNLAVSLLKLGMGEEDVVAMGSEKRITFLPTTLSIMLTGATCSSFDLANGKSILRHKLSLINPKFVVCSKLFLEKYEEILRDFDCIKTYITLDDTTSSNIITVQSLLSKEADVRNFEPAPVKGQIATALVMYSSGTTGYPKGISLTHMNCIINSLPDHFMDKNIRTVYISGEWYHNYDLFMTCQTLAAGKKVAFVNNVTLPEVLTCIEKYQVDIAIVVPFLLYMLCKEENLSNYNLESLKIIYSRASLLHSKTIEIIQTRLPNLQNVLQGYGMTECGELASEMWGTKGPKPGSVGMASSGITLKVVDIETGKKLGPNKAGEIRVMGPMFMKEYINIDSTNYLDEEDFFKTGDMGYYDEDNYFFIVGRIKDVIDYKGDKVAPIELETILEQHPDIVEAGVVGKPHPDCGELPTAFIVKKPNSSITERDIIDYMVEEVSPFMQLHGGVIFIKELPRNPRGKILHRELRDMLIKSL